jgi:YegS/Rv2252/BmrU family lipid kinase
VAAPPQKPVFLVNPASANGQTGKRWPEIAHRASELGLSGDALLSEEPGQLGSLARQAVARGADQLVVVGGDGSVNEVVNGMAGLGGVEFSVISQGTGWDFIRTYDIPRNIEDAVRIALDGDVREIDLGLVTYRTWAGSDGRAYFANIASAGISGAIAQRANSTTKALGGKASYYLATMSVFARWKTGEMRVSVDDEIRGGRIIDVVVANGRYLGGGMMMCPEAEPDDGLFDVLVIGDVTKRDLLLTLPKSYKGRHLPHPRLEPMRGRVVTIDAPSALPVELDGEQPGTTPARFEIVPRAVRLRVPAPSE